MNKDALAKLHRTAEPLVIFNIWDAGSAKAVAEAGAKVIATGSLALAGAQGFEDGEQIPFDHLLYLVHQIAAQISVPLSVDLETGYAETLDGLTQNAESLVRAGVSGCNLEDRLQTTDGLREADEQADRIRTAGAPGLFVNARTDLFLGPLMAGEDPNRSDLVDQAVERATIYGDAGAGCFFAPGLSNPDLIKELCARAGMPVNIMRLEGMPSNADLGALGVARISHGPGPWRRAMEVTEAAARAAFVI
uniref:isocitrate lyase/PEP mutase family protein n=1 Tax=uncultured Erythrobacter sp. TaxID=263913 RepID=UPI002630C5F6|nr:isocitrate lyase/phosphoenolpyruvate mutase family protein [uncultured Erythrobacter sp.]